jgi:hypothetical protein
MEHFRNDCICSTVNQAFQNLIESVTNLRLLNRNINSGNNNPNINLNNNNSETLVLVIIIISLMSVIFNRFKAKMKKEKSCNVNQGNN